MHIVLVDDSQTIAVLIEEMLRALDEKTEFTAFLDPLLAVEWCEDNHVDLLLVDYMMPHMNGLEFLERFKQCPRHQLVPTLMVTSNLDPQVRYRALQSGVNDFLTKPIDEIEFVARIRNMLQLRRQQLVLSDQKRLLAEEVKRTCNALQQRDAQLRKLSLAVEQSGSSVIITDTQGNIEYVNPRFTEVTGYTLDEVRGKNPRLLKPADEPSQNHLYLWEKIRAGRPWFGEFRNQRKDGTCYWQVASIVPLVDGDGKITHYVGIGEDITDQKKLEESLRALNRDLEQKVQEETSKRLQQQHLMLQESRILAMGEMIGAIAHHWRQPLNSVGLMVQKVLLDYESGELNAETLGKFVRDTMVTVQGMSRVIDEFRDIFEPDSIQQPFKLADAFCAAMKVVGAQMDNHAIKVTLHHPEEPVWITGYPKEFQQALLSILGNAKDAIVLGKISAGRIEITTELDGEHVTITIADNGGGINPVIMDRIFEPYFTTKERGRGSGIITGTGIGLYMSKMIIEEKMLGTLSAINTHGGACFIIRLPRCTATSCPLPGV